MVDKDVKYFKMKSPLWARIITMGMFFVFSAVVIYAPCKQTKISLEFQKRFRDVKTADILSKEIKKRKIFLTKIFMT